MYGRCECVCIINVYKIISIVRCTEGAHGIDRKKIKPMYAHEYEIWIDFINARKFNWNCVSTIWAMIKILDKTKKTMRNKNVLGSHKLYCARKLHCGVSVMQTTICCILWSHLIQSSTNSAGINKDVFC